MDTGNYTEGNDLVTRLLKNLTIDNNIFGYIPIEQIILVSYPPELEFYSSDDQNTPLPNGTIIDKTHILSQNRRLNKTHKYYYLEYQFLIHLNHSLLIFMIKKKMVIILSIKIFIVKKHFMEEQIDYILNYAMIIVKHVINLDYQFIIKNVILV